MRRRKSVSMTPLERRAVGSLAAIFALRLLGLFLILPVFALYADRLEGHTPFLVGLALGAYGLTQALLQIPFGMASDRLGRKPVIAVGLIIFAIGSAVAATAASIEGVVLGRALQGAGAISAAVVAMIADLTREETRTRAMAAVGITIGASFFVSLLAGPVLNTAIGVPGIFWLMAALALGGIGVLYLAVPTPVRSILHRDVEPAPHQFMRVLRDARLLRLNLGIFILHVVLMALFVVVPVALVRQAGLPAGNHWQVYLPVLVLSAVFMLPLIVLAERRHWLRPIFAGAVGLLLLSQVVLYRGHTSLAPILLGLFVFFTAFNVLEAMLPSLISKTAPASSKGTAIGIYSTFEFFGAFVGGAAGGYLHGRYGIPGVFVFGAVLLAFWLLLALTMPAPRYLASRLLHVGRMKAAEARALAQRLAAVRGVAEATVVAEEGVAYLKVDELILDAKTLDRYHAPT
ncbi:MAG: MFS transporter [Candidatus Muproteobacteria bacterium RBG_16_65_31]|uniref:MFS transporter n=1 Tax=Candidatus Muproteobacteria bacterium RBG_16_65_31 TaxID=1817759 RepID=A0A1F6TGI7_9PROT|nr:MAG: MFS transporter [Candidatus Muproteobacteria bacterium RBG_16_65_31]